MHYSISFYSNDAYQEFLLPSMENTEVSVILSEKIFQVEKDVEVKLDNINGKWYFEKNDGYSIYDIKNRTLDIYKESLYSNMLLELALDDQDTIDYAGESDALHYGMVQYYSMWETDSSYINLGLSAENYEEKLIITYEDKNYEENLDDSGL